MTLPKGTQIRLRTINGGDVIATLLEGYRPTYDVVVSINGHCIIIPAWRVKSIEMPQ